MALGAVLFKQISSRGNGFRIVLERIVFCAGFLRGLDNLGINRAILVHLEIVPLSRGGERQEKEGSRGSCGQCGSPHCRLPNRLRTISPNPENSLDTPQRITKPWLLSLSPNPGETRKVQLEGRFHASTGAR